MPFDIGVFYSLLSAPSTFTVAVGNQFKSCDLFEPNDFRAIAHVRGSGTQRVTLNETVTGRFVSLYLNETGVLQLYDVEVCAASAQPRETSRECFKLCKTPGIQAFLLTGSYSLSNITFYLKS